MMGRLKGDIIILGVAGKIGVTLALTAKRAAEEAGIAKRVVGVARFSNPDSRCQLEQAGVETITCDLLNRDSLARLPTLENVVYMAGRKFGTRGDESQTWAANVVVPANVAEHFRGSRIVAFSTGCVYPLAPVADGGSVETEPVGGIGEYAQSCVGRERVFEHFSQRYEIPVCLLRLYYCIDLRYGVLHDLARQILDGEPVDLTMAAFNCLWQGDANNMALLALDRCRAPAVALNITAGETHFIRDVAQKLARALGREVRFTGEEAPTAYVGNGDAACSVLGKPTVDLDTMIAWTVSWLERGGRSLNLPTHFQTRDGKY